MTNTLTKPKKASWLWLPIIVLLGGLAAIIISDPAGSDSIEEPPKVPTVESTFEAPAQG